MFYLFLRCQLFSIQEMAQNPIQQRRGYNFIKNTTSMIYQEYFQEENSLDILLKFEGEHKEQQPSQPVDFENEEKQFSKTQEMDSFQQEIQEIKDPRNFSQEEDFLEKMMVARSEQQEKLVTLMTKKVSSKLSPLKVGKRKASECTEAPTSPTRKTKQVRKVKS